MIEIYLKTCYNKFNDNGFAVVFHGGNSVYSRDDVRRNVKC